MKNIAQKPTFATTQSPLLKTSDGRNITDNLILTSDSVLQELIEYYEWEVMDFDIPVFRAFLTLHYISKYDGQTYEMFIEKAEGSYSSLASFAYEYAVKMGDDNDTPYYMLEAVDWEKAGKELISSDDFYRITIPNSPEIYVFRA